MSSVIIKEIKQDLGKKPTERYIGGWLMTALTNTIVSEATTNGFTEWLCEHIGFCKNEYNNFVNSTNQKFANISEIIEEKLSALIEQMANLRSDHSKEINVVDTKIDNVKEELQNRLKKLEEAMKQFEGNNSLTTALSTTLGNRSKTGDIQQTDVDTMLFLNNLPIEEIIEIICLGYANFWQVRCNEQDLKTIANWQKPLNLETIKMYFRRKYIYKQVKEQILGQINNPSNGFFNNLYDSIQVVENENPTLGYNEIINLIVPMFIQKHEYLATSEETIIAESPVIQETIVEPLDDGKPAKKKTKK